MNGQNHEIPKVTEIRHSENNERFLPHMRHTSRFNNTTGNQSYAIFGDQTLQHICDTEVSNLLTMSV